MSNSRGNRFQLLVYRASVALAVSVSLSGAPSFAAWQEEGTKTADKAADSDKAAEAAKPKREPIYDEAADAEKQIDEALAQARKENRRVIVQWGANWCGWCYLLHDLFQKNPEVRRKLMYEYDVVLVDIGRMDKNEALLEKYKVDLKSNGVPFLTVLDANGEVIVNQETSSLESKEEGAHEHDPNAVMEFLTKYEAQPLDADSILESAMDRARAEGKLVFLHFGAPWCGWCHYLENWMAEPDVAQRLDSVFVDVKIDQDRMTNAESVFKKYCEKPGGIPWFVFIDGKSGDVVATSDAEGGNVGFPSTDEEITHFCKMLEGCGNRFDEASIAWFRDSLVANRTARESARSRR